MKDADKSKEQLIEELLELRRQVFALQANAVKLEQVEDSLLEEKTLSKATLDSLPGIFYLFTERGVILRWNKNFEIVSGYSGKEIEVMHPLDFFSAEERPKIAEIIKEVFLTGESTVEANFVVKTGDKIPYLFTGRNITLEGTPCLLGTAIDITSLKRAEESLRESEKKYRSLYHEFQGILNTIPDTVRLLSTDLKILWANELPSTPKDILNISEIGKYCYPPRHGRPEPCEDCPVLRCFSSGKMETEVHTAHGRVWELRAFPVYDDQGEVRGGLEVARDITEAKQAREALIQSEERYRCLVEDQVELVSRLRPDGTLLFVNEGFCRFFGKTKGELLGTKWRPLFNEEDLPRVAAQLAALGPENPVALIENRVYAADGKTRWVQFSNRAFFDENCEISEIQSVGRDITGQKQAEAALRESEELYRNLYETSLVGLWRTRLEDGKFIRSNRANANILGIDDPDELVSNYSASEFYSPQRRVEFIELLKRDKQISNFEVDLTFKDGTQKGISVSAKIFEEQGYIEGAIVDITDRKRAEMELRRLAEAVRQASEGIVITDPAGNIQYANPITEKITGYAVAEIIGQNPRFLKSGKQDQAFYQHLWNTILAGERWSGHMVNKRKDGGFYTVECSISPVKGENGAIVNFVWITRDVTNELELEERLRQAQKMEAIGTLAGGIAHDFNNILSAIMGFTELNLISMPEDSEEYQNLHEVMRASERAKDLVNQILTFSRKTSQEKKPLQISLVVNEALKLLRSTIPTTIDIHSHITASHAKVLADPTQIHQIIMNLCTNAAHAMREKGGTLEVRLAEKYLAKEDLLSNPGLSPGPFVSLTISDTGHGIAPEYLEHIFEPFFTTKGVGEGTGMGLAVAYGIVKAHSGWVTVSSQPEAGATFTVLLPKIVGGDVEAEKVTVTIPRGRGRLLLIDDEQVLVDLNKRLLEKLGYEVYSSNKSLEALIIFQSQPDEFDLVITDQTMPHMTGLQLVQELRRIRSDIPIILCTGFSDKVSEETVQAAGIDALLMKPINLRSLAETVKNILEKENQGC